MNRFYLLFVFILLSMGSCAQSNETYCAEVDRYNPTTGKESSYRLTVRVENNRVVRLDWPNGGSSDSDEN